MGLVYWRTLRAASLLPLLSSASCSLMGYDVLDGGHLALHSEDAGTHLPDSFAPTEGNDPADGGPADSAPKDTIDAELADAGSLPFEDAGVAIPPDAGDEAAGDAAPIPDLDATTLDPPDASTDAGAEDRDASPLDPTDAGDTDASIATCAGTPAIGLCWYLGVLGASCDQTCASQGGYDVRATSAVGSPSQGGSYANCRAVLLAFGITRLPTAGYRSDGQGLGCHVWVSGETWWLDDRGPVFSPAASYRNGRVACGCLR